MTDVDPSPVEFASRLLYDKHAPTSGVARFERRVPPGEALRCAVELHPDGERILLAAYEMSKTGTLPCMEPTPQEREP